MAKQIRCVNSIYVNKTIAANFLYPILARYCCPVDGYTPIEKLNNIVSDYDCYEINRESLNNTIFKNCEITNKSCDCAEIKLYKMGA